MSESLLPITLPASVYAMRERARRGYPPPWPVFDADAVLRAEADGALAVMAARAAAVALHPADEMRGDATMLELVTSCGRFVPVTLTSCGGIIAAPKDQPHRGLDVRDWRAIAACVTALDDAVRAQNTVLDLAPA